MFTAAAYSAAANADYDPSFGETEEDVQNDEDEYDEDDGEEEDQFEKLSIETQPQTIEAEQDSRIVLPCLVMGPCKYFFFRFADFN